MLILLKQQQLRARLQVRGAMVENGDTVEPQRLANLAMVIYTVICPSS